MRNHRYLPVLLLFTMAAANLAAAGPTGVSPGDTDRVSSIANSCPTFSWSAVQRATAYELVVYEVGDEAKTALEQAIPGSALSWTPDLDDCLDPGAEYAWSVRAVRQNHASGWSSPRLFRVSARHADMELAEALAVLRRYLEEAQGAGDELAPALSDLAKLRSMASRESAPAAGPPSNGVAVDPATETAVLFRDDVGDNFGVLVDSLAVSGSEIGLHSGPSGYASLAKNAYFLGGWQRFNEALGAYLQEVSPTGEVTFNVAPAGVNPIVWSTAMHIDADGKIGIGTIPFSLSRLHGFGGSSLHGVSGSTNASNRAGVYGSTNTAGAYGVSGHNSGSSGTTAGVYGRSDSSTGSGVHGLASAQGVNNGVFGVSNSETGRGVYGEGSAFAGANTGVLGVSNSPGGYGIYGKSLFNNYAGYFEGKVAVDGTLEIGPVGDLVTLSFNDSTDTLTADQNLTVAGTLAAGKLELENQEAISNSVDGTVTVTANYLQIPTVGVVPGTASCDAAGIGRMVYETSGKLLYICGLAGWTTH